MLISWSELEIDESTGASSGHDDQKQQSCPRNREQPARNATYQIFYILVPYKPLTDQHCANSEEGSHYVKGRYNENRILV